METRVTKGQTIYSLSLIICLIIAMMLTLIDYFFEASKVCLLIFVILFIGLICYLISIRHIKLSLLNLIQTSENILEQKDINEWIDGESYISVLSSQLYLLDKRIKHMLEQLSLEQKKIQDYVEDISHQMKTPLTSLMLKEDILLEKIPQEESHIEDMIYQTQRMKSLIESLLHLAKIESQTIQYHFQECSLSLLIENIRLNLKPLLDKYQVTIQCEFSKEIYCDPRWFEEALENIIKNCVEQEECSQVMISCKESLMETYLYIQDNGSGFSKDDLPHILKGFIIMYIKKKVLV